MRTQYPPLRNYAGSGTVHTRQTIIADLHCGRVIPSRWIVIVSPSEIRTAKWRVAPREPGVEIGICKGRLVPGISISDVYLNIARVREF